jgi:hypothetical protein
MKSVELKHQIRGGYGCLLKVWLAEQWCQLARALTWRQLVCEELDVAAHKQAAVAVIVLLGHLQWRRRGAAAAAAAEYMRCCQYCTWWAVRLLSVYCCG